MRPFSYFDSKFIINLARGLFLQRVINYDESIVTPWGFTMDTPCLPSLIPGQDNNAYDRPLGSRWRSTPSKWMKRIWGSVWHTAQSSPMLCLLRGSWTGPIHGLRNGPWTCTALITILVLGTVYLFVMPLSTYKLNCALWVMEQASRVIHLDLSPWPQMIFANPFRDVSYAAEWDHSTPQNGFRYYVLLSWLIISTRINHKMQGWPMHCLSPSDHWIYPDYGSKTLLKFNLWAAAPYQTRFSRLVKKWGKLWIIGILDYMPIAISLFQIPPNPCHMPLIPQRGFPSAQCQRRRFINFIPQGLSNRPGDLSESTVSSDLKWQELSRGNGDMLLDARIRRCQKETLRVCR